MPIDGWIAVQCHSPGRISRIHRIVRQHELGALDPLSKDLANAALGAARPPESRCRRRSESQSFAMRVLKPAPEPPQRNSLFDSMARIVDARSCRLVSADAA